jgi:hypothetical protein
VILVSGRDCRSGFVRLRSAGWNGSVHGFAKNERDNIDDKELAAFKLLAAQLVAYDEAALAKAIAAGVLTEVKRDDQTIS